VSEPGPALFESHRRTVRAMAGPGGVLSPGAPTASVANPAWFVGGDPDLPTPSRLGLWRELLAEAEAGWVRAGRRRRGIVLAGPPGAGKTTVLGEVLGGEAHRWAVVDADRFKVALLRRALADGSYEGFLKPGAVRAAEASGEVFRPLELAPLVHEESGALARASRDRAIGGGLDLVVDTVLSDARAAVRLGQRLDAAGYSLEVIDVEVPYDLSRRRVTERWRQAWADPGDALGGRWVPSDYTRSVFDDATGRTRSQRAAELLGRACPAVTRLRRYWTEAAGSERVLEVDLTRDRPGGPLTPRTAPTP
jgi:chloramphenicol 3-O-phosphotransferase